MMTHSSRRKPSARPFRVAAVFLATLASLSLAAQETTPSIPGVVAGGTPIQLIRGGFDGTEGPVSLPDGSVLFTETRASRITHIAADGAVSTFLEHTNGANGLGFTPDGDLVSVQTVKPQVGVVYPKGRERVLADQFEGRPLNRPNDLVVDRRGGVYFTDPGAQVKPGETPPVRAVYYITPAGTLLRLATDIERPNGIQLSPDEKVLYVANTAGEYIVAYDLHDDGRVGPRRNFARLEGLRQTDNGPSGGADGLAVDALGRLYVASSLGIQVFDPQGAALGIIPLPKAPQNLAFAGSDKKTLYIVGRGAAYRIATLTAGYAGRAK